MKIHYFLAAFAAVVLAATVVGLIPQLSNLKANNDGAKDAKEAWAKGCPVKFVQPDDVRYQREAGFFIRWFDSKRGLKFKIQRDKNRGYAEGYNQTISEILRNGNLTIRCIDKVISDNEFLQIVKEGTPTYRQMPADLETGLVVFQVPNGVAIKKRSNKKATSIIAFDNPPNEFMLYHVGNRTLSILRIENKFYCMSHDSGEIVVEFCPSKEYETWGQAKPETGQE